MYLLVRHHAAWPNVNIQEDYSRNLLAAPGTCLFPAPADLRRCQLYRFQTSHRPIPRHFRGCQKDHSDYLFFVQLCELFCQNFHETRHNPLKIQHPLRLSKRPLFLHVQQFPTLLQRAGVFQHSCNNAVQHTRKRV